MDNTQRKYNSATNISDFLNELPSQNTKNFSQIDMEQGLRTSQKRPSVYLPTEEMPSEQHIVMDKRCVLLRYLTQQWDKKSLPRKREHTGGDGGSAVGVAIGSTGNGNCNSKKRPRLEPVELNAV